MTENDFVSILQFYGKSDFCFAVLKKTVGEKKFVELLKKFNHKDYYRICADTNKKNFYFINATRNNHFNCFLLHPDNGIVTFDTQGCFVVDRKYIEGKLKEKQGCFVRTLSPREVKALDAKKPKQKEEKTKPLTNKKQEYQEFLETDYWKNVRETKISMSGYKCQLCGSKSNLNVHHNSYEHHGQEHKHLEDLVVLCRECHEVFHKIGKIKD